MQFEAITWARLADALADHLDGLKPAEGGAWLRAGVDGAPAARTGEIAERVAEALRLRGRTVYNSRPAVCCCCTVRCCSGTGFRST